MRKLGENRTYRVVFGIILAFLLMGFLQSHWRQTNIGWVTTAEASEDQADLPRTEPPSSTSTTAEAGRSESGHSDPFSVILLEVAVIIGVAGIGRWVAGKFEQPSVLGELLIGVVVGNIGYWLGWPFFVLVMELGNAGPLLAEVWNSGQSVAEAATHVFSASELAHGGVGQQVVETVTGPGGSSYVAMGFALWLFSNLGVVLLLFMVGLESSLDDMFRVGPRAAMVAVLGIIAPFCLGLLVTIALLPDFGMPVHLFLAATLCATSVGITARVLKDLRRIQTSEAKIILGAAVIDDILGLIILAVVVGIVATGQIDVWEIGKISLLSCIFLGSVLLLGDRLIRWTVPLVAALDRHHCKLLFPLAVAFAMAWLANTIQLAAIVGAFAAGLILNEKHFERHCQKTTMKELIAPLEAIFAPIFFVLMGMQVNLRTFLEPGTLWLALALTLAAVTGKLVCGLPAGRANDRLSVGVGMVPRGEVGLIFASIGKGLGVVSGPVFSALVVMVFATTLLTPTMLKWSFSRGTPNTQRSDLETSR